MKTKLAKEISKCVLLYSGGLDTSCMLKWLQETYNCELVTVTLDVGQKKNFKEIEEKSKQLGAVAHYTIDAREEFVKNYVNHAIKANALYEGEYPLSSSLSKPLIANWGVKIAEKEEADAIAHGCTGKGNDQVRFNITIETLNPEIKVISPVVEWGMTRIQEIEYAKKKGIPIPVDVSSPYSIDANLWGRSIECGILEKPDVEPPEEIYEWTKKPEEAEDKSETIKLTFEKGIPTALNDEEMNEVELIMELNEIGGKHGVGRIDHMEDRIVGLKSREVYECPAATIIIKAHKDLEKYVSTRHEVLFKETVDKEWAFLAYAGLWIDPLKKDLDAFIDSVNEKVTGEVKMKLYKGHSMVVGRKSEYALYDLNLATYEEISTFDQKLSKGFIKLWGLQSKMSRLVSKRKEAVQITL